MGLPPGLEPGSAFRQAYQGWPLLASQLKFARVQLKDSIPEGINLRELSPADWEEEETALFEGATNGEGVLCLFDHNLQGSPGYSDSSGILLLGNAVNEKENRPIICGLLTHTVREGQEIRRSSELAEEHGLNRKDFLVLSKDRLSVPMQLAHGLKMMSLNYARDFLTDQIKGIATEASEQANQQLMEVDIYNFDYMVLRSSEKEGLWEAETLFRLFDIFRLTAFREKAFAQDNRQILDERIAQIRAIREVATVPDEGEQYPPTQEWGIRQLELYESGDFINRAHLPLELGDIFAVGERRFVLLAQPCDLMVRKGGKRQSQTVTLVKITLDRPTNPLSGNCYVLDYFDESGKDARVKFRSAYPVSASVLDLAVFNPDGRCRLDVQSAPPPVLHTPWRARFEVVKRELGRHRDRIVEILSGLRRANLTTGSRQLLEKSLTGKLTQSSLSIPLDYNLLSTGIFDFGIRRIGRYRQPDAARLFGSYFAFLSRDAVDHDYVSPKPLAPGVWECIDIAQAEYVGSKRTTRFHKPDCPHAKRISNQNRIRFENRESAIDYGREPCDACEP